MSISLKERRVIRKLLSAGVLTRKGFIPNPHQKTSDSNVLLCFPFDTVSFKIARNIFFPFIMENQERAKAVIYQAFIPIIKDLDTACFYPLKNSDIDKTSLPTEKFMKRVFRGTYIFAADLNIKFNLTTAYLTYNTGAKQRVGFSSEVSREFFNTEIRKKTEDLIESGYLYTRQLLLTILEQSGRPL